MSAMREHIRWVPSDCNPTGASGHTIQGHLQLTVYLTIGCEPEVLCLGMVLPCHRDPGG